MKKALLLATTFGLTALTFNSNAQVFTIEYENTADTFVTTGTPETPSLLTDIKLNTKIVPDTGIDTFTIEWQIVSSGTSLPNGWLLAGFCDNSTCYENPTQDSVHVTNPITDQVSSQTMYPWISSPTNTADSGIGVIKVSIEAVDVVPSGSSQTEELVYIVHKTTNSVGINLIPVKDKRISIYPVPTENNIIVYTDKSLNATSVQIIDITGRLLSTNALNSSKEANVVVTDNLQTGNYVVNIIDNTGKVIAARKFVKN